LAITVLAFSFPTTGFAANQKGLPPVLRREESGRLRFATHCIELNLMAQTATYVTHEIVS
jgi:hypothetical protein